MIMVTALNNQPYLPAEGRSQVVASLRQSVVSQIAEIAQQKGISKSRTIEETLLLGLGEHPGINTEYLLALAAKIAERTGESPEEVLQRTVDLLNSRQPVTTATA